jgi:hypothetical protein
MEHPFYNFSAFLDSHSDPMTLLNTDPTRNRILVLVNKDCVGMCIPTPALQLRKYHSPKKEDHQSDLCFAGSSDLGLQRSYTPIIVQYHTPYTFHLKAKTT